MKRKGLNIIPVIILIFLAIFLYINNRNSNKEISKTPSASISATQAATQSPVSTSTPALTQSENFKTEAVKDFNITVNIPEQWVKKPQYDNRYEGDSGFAEFTAMSGYGLSLKETADLQISNELKPLGDSPRIINTTIDSQEAAIILPSGNDTKAQSAILIKFPKSIVISGTPYYYLLIWTDKAHAEKISNDIKFIK